MSAQKNLTWYCQPFDNLKPRQLHDILRLRSGIFQLEQNCLYADIDGEDLHALHLFAVDGSEHIVAAARLFLPGDTYKGKRQDIAWIGRVVVAASQRGLGVGHDLMRAAIAEIRARHDGTVIALSAQAHLKSFYAAHGFLQCGETYKEDDIPHIEMRLS